MTRSCHWGVGHGQDTHISGWGEEQKLQGTVTGARIPGSFPPPPPATPVQGRQKSVIAQRRAESGSAGVRPRPPALRRWH